MSLIHFFSVLNKAKPYIAAIVGNIICGLGINAFFIPHHLLSSGLSGIGIIIYYALGFPVGTTVFILNIPIMIACYKYMGKTYTLISLIGTVLFSAAIDLTAFTAQWDIIKDPMLSCIAGGITTGFGFGILYKYNVNSGGMDVVAAIVKKYYSLEMGNVVMGMNTLVLLCSAYMFSLEPAVLTFVGITIATIVTNKVVIGMKQRKSVIIISNHAEEIANVLMRYIGHGATYLYGQGAYTMQDKRIIYAVIKLTEVSKIKEIVNKLDSSAFMIISDASEVVGRGFTIPAPKYHTHPGDSLVMPRTRTSRPPEY
ncbi:YitT family protein [uncultured Megasphaera sp.]|uniref:YitT family protein n=1 Tax=uncultured Megasphaera sp. TaxID=165188 RepID=UPI0012E30A20|nr:YitT family protein [uncultured Megasphaera sp.]MUP59176.1 YitT family protein [Veillonellaceae bacterium M2-4]